MADCMTFPETVDEFIEQYGIRDTEEVYTNGSMLIPVFRVGQMIDHYFPERTCNFSDHVADVAWCSECKKPMEYPNHPNYCPNCGAKVVE